jgi:hypothetical protein
MYMIRKALKAKVNTQVNFWLFLGLRSRWRTLKSEKSPEKCQKMAFPGVKSACRPMGTSGYGYQNNSVP